MIVSIKVLAGLIVSIRAGRLGIQFLVWLLATEIINFDSDTRYVLCVYCISLLAVNLVSSVLIIKLTC